MPKKAIIILHLIFWFIHILVEYYLFQYPHQLEEEATTFWVKNTLTWVTFIFYFYFNYAYLIPKFLLSNQPINYILNTLFTSVFCFLILSQNWSEFTWDLLAFPKYLIPLILFGLFMHYFVSTAIKMLDYFLTSERIKIQLQKELSETELSYLQSQLSPHFLFNTLNNIYSLTLDKSEKTIPALQKLDSLMSYIQEYQNERKISIEKEINQIESYVELSKLRFDCEIKLTQNIPNKVKIEPLFFLPFVENALKHGDTTSYSTIEITFSLIDENTIKFSISNPLFEKKQKDSIGGIGIINIRRRLELLYPNKYTLEAKKHKNQFIVNLTINLEKKD